MQDDIALSPFSPLPPLPTELPLFPLHTVLFPGGLLPLRIFEARYIDMVRTCLREQTPFGVCLIERGNEVAADTPTVPVDIGCIAHIVECDMEQLGLLMIKARGTQRFKVRSVDTTVGGLLRGTVEPIGADLEDCKGELFDDCVNALRRIVTTLGAREEGQVPLAEPYDWASPSWVGNRLCELLPVPLKAKQKLMELMDAGMRIEIVHRYMKQHHIL
ncbi:MULTISPECIES: LON peptidase substrate-binding domain-containing protein [Ralstonia solanacearum species complex]|uniref:Peptidase protein n=3 Tax=Ralstonia solanacearum species complex TaxID=3116862 RepID=Q8Y2D4_RALN1|nr:MULTISPECIES: LON peptidase substrate-binding domain-containing protein [Ralstonia solanacearum species complex]AXW39538.1 ATP-dependent protease [Ralstonia solanacearum]AST26089.1 ATP-dependent protease [Ralstonia pseudosolanacearum]MBX9431681.1 LON peptidase substrate-binding domain-containing protein [Ralstonia pseudosolanacearum]MCD9227814.1 LON peptidase substrate-binding domain-containing protein [Ralstonia pseudosolanacearum]MCK4122624.1 LON peptidase substrate-binding domain-contain